MKHLITMDDLEPFVIEPGERGYIMEGSKHGFAMSSVIVTETAPGGGPRLHTHTTEEVHVLLEGQMRYIIGDTQFDARGPYIVNIPADTPHAFMNSGDVPLRLICFFPYPEIWSQMVGLGRNPLLTDV